MSSCLPFIIMEQFHVWWNQFLHMFLHREGCSQCRCFSEHNQLFMWSQYFTSVTLKEKDICTGICVNDTFFTSCSSRMMIKSVRVSVLSYVFGSWFDHVKGWLSSEANGHILYISYEEMIMMSLSTNKATWKHRLSVGTTSLYVCPHDAGPEGLCVQNCSILGQTSGLRCAGEDSRAMFVQEHEEEE